MRIAAAVVFSAFALCLYLLIWRDAPLEEGDSPQYLEVAHDLADGRLDALHDRPPGYPVLLVLTGSATGPTRILFLVSLLLHAAVVWMLAAMLRAAAVAPAWIVAFVVVLMLPPYVEPAGHVMTENLAQFTLVAGFTALVTGVVRRKTWLLAVAAVAFVTGSLTRPIYQALAPAIATCLVVTAAARGSERVALREAFKGAVVLLVISTVLLGGYALSNRVRFGFFGVTPTLGFHLTTKTIPFIERLPEDYAAVREVLVREREAELTKRGGTHTGTQTIWAARPKLAEVTGLSTPELSRFLVRMNLDLIARAPIEYLQEVARSMATYWFPPAGHLASMELTVLRWTWALLHFAVLAAFGLPLLVFTSVLLFEFTRSRGGIRAAPPIRATHFQAFAYTLAGAIVFYNMLLSCFLDIGETRQRRPTEALIVFMCVLGVHLWRQSVRASIPGPEAPRLP